ncbi:MAG TPA: ROK family transcriptional regulator [Actinomycetes bacterium]|nr:ROK family transcriptional regulator [Actinomycetes bacterium]
MPQRPGTPQLLRAINDRAALELLIEHGPLTRTQIGDLTGLSKPTAAQLLARLEARGLVHEVGETEGGRGPNARLYAVVPSAAYVAGLHVGPQSIGAAVADITGRTVAETELGIAGVEDPVAVLHEAVERAGRAAGITLDRLHGLVVGTPGLVDPPTGDFAFASDLPSWHRGLLPALREDLRRRVSLENDVNLAAVAELHHGVAVERDSFALIWVGRGVGLSTVISGRLHRGAGGGAGEIGYLPVPGAPVTAVRREPGVVEGAFQSQVGAIGVQALASQLGLPPASPERTVADALGSGSSGREFLDELARRLAVGVASVCAVLDPGLVVLAGEIGRAGGKELAARVEAGASAISPLRVEVRVSTVEGNSVLQGALLTALSAARDDVFDSTTEPVAEL